MNKNLLNVYGAIIMAVGDRSFDVSVSSVIAELLPAGARGRGDQVDAGDITKYPVWPPDMFGVTASLLMQSDAYTCLQQHSSGALGDVIDSELLELEAYGESWALSADVETDLASSLQELWDVLVCTREPINSFKPTSLWIIAATKLAIISDVACGGMGFHAWEASDEFNYWVPALFHLLNAGFISPGEFEEKIFINPYGFDGDLLRIAEDRIKKEERVITDYQQSTASIFIPPAKLCVLPKTRTAMVGSTLRSLTHHLSLHPGVGQLKSSWMMPSVLTDAEQHSFNILFIPYPFEISADAFRKRVGPKNSYGIFDINQTWLSQEDGSSSSGPVKLVSELIEKAKKEVGKVDLVLFPELALNEEIYEEVFEFLQKKDGGAHQMMLIAGVLGKENGYPFNRAHFSIVGQEGESGYFRQNKHHRWALDRNQIERYSLADQLNPEVRWWENIQVDNRELNFVIFRRGSCLTTLICEDLARTDPCQSSLRAVGPNLVIALLMDGPQIPGRWPDRYAMGLAEDPGSSVLSVTSLGLVERSNQFYNCNNRTVGLWRDSLGGDKALELPDGKRGLLLTLSSSEIEEEALDGRRDDHNALVWRLTGNIAL